MVLRSYVLFVVDLRDADAKAERHEFSCADCYHLFIASLPLHFDPIPEEEWGAIAFRSVNATRFLSSRAAAV